MEQKKLLLVFVSVGVFLVIVLGAGILFFKPPSKPALGATSFTAPKPSAPASADPTEWVRNPQAVSGLQQPAAENPSARGDVIIIYGERPTGTPPASASSTATVTPDGGLRVDVAVPQTPTPPAPAAAPETRTATVTATSSSTAPAAEIKKTAAAKKPAAAPKQPAKTGDAFWIQTGSFSAKARADAAKETLGAKGISSLVETKEVSGKTFFRVRVGPYSSKNEADYWLSLVKTIDGFGGSYVSQVKGARL